MNLTITGYSTALFSTWFFIEELGILFDAGDGVCSQLLQKSGKIKYVFISHADRDHLTGLLQFNQLNAKSGFPKIMYPKDCGSFRALEEFSKKFDPQVKGTVWNPIDETIKIHLRKDLFVQGIPNDHVLETNGQTKSMGYQVMETKRKLKPEFGNLTSQEIKTIVQNHGPEYLTQKIQSNILSYSGDTPVDYEIWDQSDILIHEATFLGTPDTSKVATHGNQHSYLEDVIKMVANIQVQQLILSHFSSRYSQAEIEENIQSLLKKYAIKIPVYRILPGETSRDILNGNPINA